MIKNKLLITSFESCTQSGFIAKSICDAMVSKNDCVIRNMPDFDSLNEYDDYLSPLKNEKSENIDTIIQYVPNDHIEYHFNYKNIVISDIEHFLKRNKSILDKLSLADEVWVFDDQHKEFLGEKIGEKTVVVGYPYSQNRIAKLFDQKNKSQSNNIKFYCITDISNIENLEILIYNFILIFHKTYNVNLYIYIKQFSNDQDLISNQIKILLDKIKQQFRLIESSVIDRIITILSGNYYIDNEPYVDLHTNGDCYINIDYNSNPDLLTASHLAKHILSIMHLKNIFQYNDNCIIETTPSNYRSSFDKLYYYNEFNTYPKINDLSIQDKLIFTYNNIINKSSPQSCYENFTKEGFFR